MAECSVGPAHARRYHARMEYRPECPPTSPQPPTQPAARDADPLADYHRVADTVGGLPNLRLKDNLYQTLFILGVTAAAAVIGFAIGGVPGLLAGLLVGLVGSFLLSGTFLMILGFIRAARK
jgi:hypothetical protein